MSDTAHASRVPAEGKYQVNIEVTITDEGLHGGREIWFKVQSNEVVDWPRVEAKLDESEAQLLKDLGRRKLFWHPDERTPEEKAASPFTFEEFWIWQQDATAGRWESA